MESTKQSLTEKQAKKLREMRGGRNILEHLNNRERQIKEIEATFEACKSQPVHATNQDLYPSEVLPLITDFDRYDDQFVVATADSEVHSKLDQTVCDAYESQAIMKSYVETGSVTLILTNHFSHTWSLLWKSYQRISMMNMKISLTLWFAITIMNSVWMMRTQHILFHLTKQKHALWHPLEP